MKRHTARECTIEGFLLLLLSVGACAPAVQDETSGAGSAPRESSGSEAAAPVLLTRSAPEGAVYHAVGAEGTLASGPATLLRVEDELGGS